MATTRPESAINNAEQASASDGNFLKFPNKPQPHSMLLVFEQYDYTAGFTDGGFSNRQDNSSQGASSIGGNRQSGIGLRSSMSIELPFPKQLTDSTNLIYNDAQQNPLLEKAVGQISKFAEGGGDRNLGNLNQQIQDVGKSMAGLGGGDLGSAIGGAASAVAKTSNADAVAASMFLLRKMVPDFVGQAVDLSLGSTINPRETIAFGGVGLKTHQFNWDLYPSSAEDSARIQDIITKLKQVVLPVTQAIGGATDAGSIKKAFLRFPHTCKLYLVGVDAQYYMKFKTCMVKDMTVDYGAGGTLGVMKGGRPAGVNIALTFQELQIETAEDHGANSAGAVQGRELEGNAVPGTPGTWTDTNGNFIGP